MRWHCFGPAGFLCDTSLAPLTLLRVATPTGLSNFSTAPLKSTEITESKELELRFEAFNLFNHAQFMNFAGEINASLFELVTRAHDPRIMQIGAKFLF